MLCVMAVFINSDLQISADNLKFWGFSLFLSATGFWRLNALFGQMAVQFLVHGLLGVHLHPHSLTSLVLLCI